MKEQELLQKCIDIYKENDRFLFVEMKPLKKFLVDSMGVKAKEAAKMPYKQAVETASANLDISNVHLYDRDLVQFGLLKKDIKEVLGITDYMVNKLLNKKGIRYKCTRPIKTGYGVKTAYVYSFYDVISLEPDAGKARSKKKPVEVPDATDENIAQALYIINKSAKTSRDTKQNAYFCRQHGVCKAAKTRSNVLYFLKDAVMKNLIAENRMEYVGVHIQKTGRTTSYLRMYKLAGFQFHMPIPSPAPSDVILTDIIEGEISAEKSSMPMNFRQAVRLLEQYSGVIANKKSMECRQMKYY